MDEELIWQVGFHHERIKLRRSIRGMVQQYLKNLAEAAMLGDSLQ